MHIYHSKDGGKSFQDITEEAYGSEELQGARGGHTPVPYFVEQGLLLGSDTGDILLSRDVSAKSWEKVAKVPGHITTLTQTDRSPSSVTH